MNKIYLDYAAATPILAEVQKAMLPYLAEDFYNPSATYLAAKKVRQDVESFRARIASHLGARPVEIIFTAGGTEANNLAIKGVMDTFPDSNVVVSAIEHESVLAPAREYSCLEAPVTTEGLIILDKLEKTINHKTVLVSIMYANNEIGTVQPLKQIAQLIQEIRATRLKRGNKRPLYLHTDACQAANYLDLHVSRLGVDMLTLNSGKIYGPKQSGALYVRAGIQLKPLISGGGQESGMRSGTPNPANLAGFAQALEIVQEDKHQESDRLKSLQKTFFEDLVTAVPGATINGSTSHRLPNNIHVTIKGQDNERLMMALDEAGIEAAVGSACSASSEEPSHVLAAIGLSEPQTRASLRFTIGRHTTVSDIRKVTSTLVKLVSDGP